ncbi:MAG: hypothetical protein NVSMB18_31950 [Acetobacteraceae bacterium]
MLAAAAAVRTPAAASPDRATLARAAAQRFPQSVRVGDLIGRQLLQPLESQPVLGRVAGVRRQADGGVDVVVRTGGVLGFGAREVAVPVEAVALLGEHVALMGLTPAELAGLPTLTVAEMPLGAGDLIRVGLVRPFH